MKIIVDADGCPVREVIIKIAKEFNLEVLMIKNICHDINDTYPRIITVDQGADSADYEIINNTRKNDIVITQDYGLAALALAKKAIVLNQNGLVFTDNNIDAMLMKRHINKKIMRKHKKYIKIKKRLKEDDNRFEVRLREIISSFHKK